MGNQITLGNLGGGAAVEKFEDELAKVIENILDPNTDAQAKRGIRLDVKIVPNCDRTFGKIEIVAQAKLAPAVAYETQAFFGKAKSGDPVAYEDNPRQTTIADFINQENQAIDLETAKDKEGTNQ
jgi:hypothetical protein